MSTSVRQCCLSLLGGYRYWISPLLRPACRCEPACSHYASVAIGRYVGWSVDGSSRPAVY